MSPVEKSSIERHREVSSIIGQAHDGSTAHGSTYSLADTHCPQCVSGKLVFNQFKDGDFKGVRYIGCEHFPRCRHFEWVQ